GAGPTWPPPPPGRRMVSRGWQSQSVQGKNRQPWSIPGLGRDVPAQHPQRLSLLGRLLPGTGGRVGYRPDCILALDAIDNILHSGRGGDGTLPQGPAGGVQVVVVVIGSQMG